MLTNLSANVLIYKATRYIGEENVCSLLERKDSGSDLFLQENVLEFLFTQNLLRFLTAANEVRHNFLGWTIRQIFVNLEVLMSKLSCELV